MREFKGTKGPWYWDDEGLGSKTMLVFGKNYPVEMTSKENKALIAAAPDLLEALLRTRAQYMQAGIDAVAGSLNPVEDNHAFINAAIAKALGETK